MIFERVCIFEQTYTQYRVSSNLLSDQLFFDMLTYPTCSYNNIEMVLVIGLAGIMQVCLVST